MEKGTFWYSVVKEKCPRCQEGDLFVSNNWYSLKNIGGMPDRCPICRQDFKMEDGFFLGATYVSYGITIGITVPVLAIIYFIFKIDYAQMLPIFIALLIALIPPVVRVSRSIWFNIFVGYEDDWKNLYAKKPALAENP